MADNQLADGNNDDDIFVYTGGDQEVPRDVKRAKIDESIDTIPRGAFRDCDQLIEVEGHNKLKKIKQWALNNCTSLRRMVNMNGVTEIEDHAFYGCHALSDLEFGKLEMIGLQAFAYCKSLRSINMPSIRRVGRWAFEGCGALTDAVFGQELGRIESNAFDTSLRRIAIPLKDDLIVENSAFILCESLMYVDVIGAGIHKIISSLHMESWRDEMKEEIERINQTLPDTQSTAKGAAINQWIESVLRRMEHYKTEHKVLVKEAMTLLELALWKAKILDKEGRKCKDTEETKSKKAKIDVNSARKEHRVTCGANIVIKNVLPFLALE